ncbi:MAG: T9SS type A sorting domain-containing protein [Bacteroidetes bacterium]|nr:T9SS type A sorting domain-containing protein [Bacteroidota bacterium]
MNNYIKLFKKVLKTASQRAMMLSQGVQKIKNATKDFYTYNNSSKTKSFKEVLMLASCIAMMLAIYTPQAEADIIQVGDGTDISSVATTTGAHPFGLMNWGNGTCTYLLTESEITAAGGQAGPITQVGLYLTTVQNMIVTGPMSVYLMNTTLTTVPNPPVIGSMTQVYSAPTFQWSTTLGSIANAWTMIPLTTSFDYTGGNLLVAFCNTTLTSNRGGSTSTVYLQGRSSVTGRHLVQYGDGASQTCTAISNTTTSYVFLPNFLLDIEMDDHDNLENTYKSAKVFQSDVTSVDRGDLDVPVLRLEVKTKGNLPPPQFIDTIKFSGKGSNLSNKISKAKLYYTGESATFNPNSAELLGTFDFASVSNTDTFKFVLPTPKSLSPNGSYNFWLVYDIHFIAVRGGTIDGKFESMHMYSTAGTTQMDPAVDDPDPEGELMVKGAYPEHIYDPLFTITVGEEPYVTLPNPIYVTDNNGHSLAPSTTYHDDCYSPLNSVTIPFPVNWDGTIYPTGTNIWLHANLHIVMGATNITYSSTPSFSNNSYNHYWALYTGDNALGYSGGAGALGATTSLGYQVLGTAPNRQFVIQWTGGDLRTRSSACNLIFQFIIYENINYQMTLNKMRLHFGPSVSPNTNASHYAVFKGNNRWINILPGTGGNVYNFEQHSTTAGWNSANFSQYIVPNRYIDFGTLDVDPKLEVVNLTPCCNNNFLVDTRPTGLEALTSFTLEVSELQDRYQGQPIECFYRIYGPLPSNNLIYEMVAPGNPSQNYVAFTSNDADINGLITYNVMQAVGTAVWSGDGRSLDFTNPAIRLGQYRTELLVRLPSERPGEDYDYVDHSVTFNIIADNDLVANVILAPERLKEYPINARPLELGASFCSNGFNPVDSFNAQIRVYTCDYDPVTGEVTNRVLYAIYPNDGINLISPSNYYTWRAIAGSPLETQGCVTLDYRHFGYFTPEISSYYDFEAVCWFANDLINDRDTSNNVFPRAGESYPIKAQSEIYPCLLGDDRIGFLEPRSDVTSLGRYLYITTYLENHGLVDISESYNLFMETWITEQSTGNIVWPATGTPHRYMVKRGGTGEGPVGIPCVDANNNLYGWRVDRSSGRFTIHSRIDWRTPVPGWPGTCRDSVTFNFTVIDGLIGNYNVGVGQHFRTINETIDSLHFRGVAGPVTFVLTDEVYNERAWTSVMRDAPALDFRSKIPGVSTTRFNPATGRDTTIIYEVRYVPSFQRSNQRGSIRVNLESLNGVGMWFGAADDSVTSRTEEPMLNLVPNLEKRDFNQSDGHITWDGGINKSIRLTYRKPTGLPTELIPYLRGEEFRSPVYITNGRNITIKNCIIEDGVNQPRSKAYLLGGNYYAGPDLMYIKDYENYIGQMNNSYSAGITVRMKPPYQERYQENRFRLDTIPCYNNVFSGNEINQFSYGIVNIGLNFRMVSSPFLIDVKDTIDMTLDDLNKSIDMTPTGSIIITNGPDTTIQIRVYRQESSINIRSSLYYKHHTEIVRGITTNTYTVIVDSALGGVMRMFNRNNTIEDNLIYDIGRIGIIMGNDENSIIRNNRIHGITGEIEHPIGYNYTTGQTIMGPADDEADCAGIYLGGRHRADSVLVDGFMVIGTQVYKNEISNISSAKSISGIKYEQTMLTEKMTNLDIEFPDAYERVNIYSNIIWGLLPRNNNVHRYGINVGISKKYKLEGDDIWQPSDTLYLSTARDSYFMNYLLVANNTIIMEEDGINTSRGDYYGLKVQKVLNSRIVNNAVEMMDTTFLFPNISTNFAAAVYYQAPTIAESNNYIDYNVYAYSKNENVLVDAYRTVTTDISGVIVDEGYRSEYKTLSNWQNWMKTDLFSTNNSFISDFETTDELFPKFRYRVDPLPINNPLEKRGMYLIEAETDIDNVDRTKGDQRLDIGAQYLNGIRFTSDVEVLNIIDPATYYSGRGPLSDAEYFMRKDEPLKVRVLLRNNGNGVLSNHPLTLRIFQEPVATNSITVNIHNNNFNDTYYNDERNHSNDNSVFPIIPTTIGAEFTETKNITIAPGEGHIVEFEVPANTFKPYWELQGHTVPMQFINMRVNVTPRYLFVANVDVAGDMDPNNNEFSKLARFYIKKTPNDILVTVSNTHYPVTDYVTVNGVLTPVPKRTVTNMDYVAGRLNFDTIIAGFRRINYIISADEEPRFDYDIIDRSVWDYRNIDYTMYKTLFYSDDLPMEQFRWEVNRYDFTKRYFQDKWLMRNLTDFLQRGTSTNKTNLIILSEEFLKDLYLADFSLLYLNRNAKDFLIHNYLRTNLVYDSLTENGPLEYHPISPLYRKSQATVGVPPVDVWTFVGQKYTFANRMGSLTGRTISDGVIFNIKETGWSWTEGARTVMDADPYGLLISAVDNMVGFNNIGLVFDTVVRPQIPLLDLSRPIPDQYRIASLAQSTTKNTVTMVTFDWRHYAEVDNLLKGIFDFLDKNSIGTDEDELPIALYDFDAVPISNRVELSWSTVKESNVRTFLIERANVNNNHIGSFKVVDVIDVENAAIVNNYNLTDRNLNYDTEYAYKLKIIGVNGEIKYSDTRKVRTESVIFEVSDITPNPVTLESEFTLVTGQTQDIYISIYDLSGKEVMLLNNKKLSSGSYNFTINAFDLVSGSYTLVIKNEQETITKQFNVVK